MLAEVTVFKASGKYYTDSEHEFEADDWNGIMVEARGMFDRGEVPGIGGDGREFTVMVKPKNSIWATVPQLFMSRVDPCETRDGDYCHHLRLIGKEAYKDLEKRLRDVLEKMEGLGPLKCPHWAHTYSDSDLESAFGDGSRVLEKCEERRQHRAECEGLVEEA